MPNAFNIPQTMWDTHVNDEHMGANACMCFWSHTI